MEIQIPAVSPFLQELTRKLVPVSLRPVNADLLPHVEEIASNPAQDGVWQESFMETDKIYEDPHGNGEKLAYFWYCARATCQNGRGSWAVRPPACDARPSQRGNSCGCPRKSR